MTPQADAKCEQYLSTQQFSVQDISHEPASKKVVIVSVTRQLAPPATVGALGTVNDIYFNKTPIGPTKAMRGVDPGETGLGTLATSGHPDTRVK